MGQNGSGAGTRNSPLPLQLAAINGHKRGCGQRGWECSSGEGGPWRRGTRTCR